MKKILAILLVATSVSTSFAVRANESIKLIVPFNAGGPTDVVARIIQTELSNKLSQPIVVENRPGASGAIGTAAVANNTKETVLLAASTSTLINPILKVSPEYNVNDLIPLVHLGRMPMYLVTAKNFNVKSIKEFQQTMHTPINFATSGPNTATEMSTDLFRKHIKKDIVTIPYRSAGQSIIDTVGGRVDGGFYFYPQIIQLMGDNRVNLLAVEWHTRLPKTPNVPTFKELNMPDVGYNNWNILFVNRAADKNKVDQIRTAMIEILKSKDVVARLQDAGFFVLPDQIVVSKDFMETETKRLLNSVTR